MVEFGKRLQEECAQHDADWHWHCIDYGALKHIIKKEKQTISGDVGEDESTVLVVAAGDAYNGGLLESSPSLHLQFQYALDREIEKAVLYVLREQGTIASELDHLAVRRAKFVDHMFSFLRRGDNYEGPSAIVSSGSQKDARIRAALNELREMHEGYAMAALSVLQFVAFVDLNVTAVRKILKKHDKITKRKLSHSYLSAYNSQDVDSHLDQLYNDGGLSSLVVSLRRAFKELHHVELELIDMMQTGEGTNQQQKHRRIQSMPASRISGSLFDLQQTIEAPPTPTPTPVDHGENALVTTHKEPLLQMIQMSRDRLRRNTEYVDIVAAQALFFAEADDEEVSSTSSEMTRSQRISSFLNLLSTFLYMTNYYIVAPTCGQYSARVGSTESMAGIVIGMTPNAALIATVLYGWWSNHSYKSALVFAAFCSFLGNIAYALALKYDSIELIMIGRALNGFGSARSINRKLLLFVVCFAFVCHLIHLNILI